MPIYLRIADQAKHLRDLGMSDRTIARVLGVSDKTVAKAAGAARAFVSEMSEPKEVS
ncbi:MAG: hypothetical protein JOY56_06340 [Solirubrobacterales bacterium]|nr:hypothetical protein [Solirubrobacterales bacterium]